jgi:long-chain acyl-CoA synthetase
VYLVALPPEKKYTPKHIDYPNIPLQGLLEASAKRFPNKTALVCPHVLTYAELDVLANQFANSLLRLRIQKGDRVALFLPNIPEFVIAYFGSLKAGAVVTAISPLHRDREVAYQLCDSGAQTIVATASLCPIVQAVKERTEIKNIIVTDTQHATPGVDLPSILTSETLSFYELIKKASTRPAKIVFNPAEDLAALQYTGGTTGVAKGAMLTHGNLLSNAVAFASTIEGTADDIFLTALPLFHIYGMTTSLTAPMSLGAQMVLLSKFEPAQALEAIQGYRVTVFCGVPIMYQMLLANSELAKTDLTSIRVCISGASSLPPQVQRRFMEITGGFLAEGYGLTEASPVTHCSPVDKSSPLRVGSIGLPIPDTQAQIVDLTTGKPLKKGEIGELSVRGPQVMKGYWRNPQETAMVLRDGWLLTGDIARLDGDGYFYIVDRKKDLIKTKGYSVYPRELEDVLYEHPAVKLCAVIGKSDALGEEVPKAYVVLKEGLYTSADELRVFVNEKVASYKAIREVEFRLELPLSGAGKVLRRTFKEEAAK